MKLAERVYLVGSGKAGFGLTDDFDCHVYALDGGGQIALIDAGGGLASAQIVANLRADGLDPERVAWILLTHAHGDHAAGTASLRGLLPAARVAASATAAAWVRTGDERAISLDIARDAGVYPRDFRFPACPVDRDLVQDDEIGIGDLRARVIETPGHADGHISFLVGHRLFAGDALFYGGRIVLQNTWDCSVAKSCATIERLAELEWDALFPGHLAFTLKGAHRHVEAALWAVRQLGVPPQLL